MQPTRDRHLAALLLTVVVFLFGYTSAIVFVPLSAVELSAPPAAIGWVVAVPGLLGFLLGIPSAALSNRLGRRPLLRVGFGSLACAAIGYIAAPSFLWLIPSQMALGFAMITYWPSALASFAESEGRRSHEAIQAANTLTQGIAGFAGAGIAGILAANLGLVAPLVAILAVAVAGFAVTFALDETLEDDVRSGGLHVPAAFSRARKLLRDDPYVALGTVALLPWSMLWWVAGASFFILYIREAGYGADFAGAMLAVRLGAASLIRLRFPTAARYLSLPQLLIGGNVVAALGLTVALISTSPAVLVLSAIVQGVGLAVVLPASNVVVSRGTRAADRAIGLSISASFNNLAIFVSAPLFGLAAAMGGTAAALGLAVVLAFAGATAMLPWRTARPAS